MSGTDEGRSGRRRRRRGNFGSKREKQSGEIHRPDTLSAAKNKDRPDRPRWIPPKVDAGPMPESDCAYCGKPIQDMDAALQDQLSGKPVHFDCVIAKLSETEKLDRGDVISYIGGGRFGIVHFGGQAPESRSRSSPAYFPDRPRPDAENNAPQGRGFSSEAAGRVFTIKKIFEWENKEHRPDWRLSIADHYSTT